MRRERKKEIENEMKMEFTVMSMRKSLFWFAHKSDRRIRVCICHAKWTASTDWVGPIAATLSAKRRPPS